MNELPKISTGAPFRIYLLSCLSEYIREHYADFSLRSMAEHFSLSEAHICRLYKQYTGRAIREPVREYRVDAACYLLSYTEKSISEIASLVGPVQKDRPHTREPVLFLK